MRILTAILFILLSSKLAMAQYQETIASSRPGQAFSSTTVGKGVFQVQSGFNFSGSQFESVDVTKTNGFDWGTIVRYGLAEKFELRTLFNVSRVGFKESDVSVSGLSNFGVGGKVNLLHPSASGPSVSLQADVSLPVSTGDFDNDEVTTNIYLTNSQSIGNAVSLSTNLGANVHDSRTIGLYVINLGFGLSDQFSAFVETYGFFNSDNFDILFDGGFAYLVNDHIQLDASVGYGKNDGFKQFFGDFGVSWRMKL
ncbi:MAG: transporter [Cyclobacteriaceae bacterium]